MNSLIKGLLCFIAHYILKGFLVLGTIYVALKGLNYVCIESLNIPNPGSLVDSENLVQQVMQTFPRTGQILGSIFSFLSAAGMTPEGGQGMLLKELACGFLLVVVYDGMQKAYRGVQLLADTICPCIKAGAIFADLMCTMCIMIFSAGVSIMFGEIMTRAFGHTGMTIGSLIIIALPLVYAWLVSLISGKSKGFSGFLNVAGRLLVDFLSVALIYLTIMCVKCFEVAKYMSGGEMTALVITTIVCILSVTLFGARAIAKIVDTD